uniref:Endonuclease/exonuclease/phosphatase domain-containing protein n=1 Tax=Octopus bimaculoides TaxID=37653 RepID=A0A0L8GDT7_OCTBM
MDKTPKRDLKILMEDLNAKVGTDNKVREWFMDRRGIGEKNENGKLFTEFCSFNDLIIGGTVFPHKKIYKTWISPNGKTEKQVDHITIDRKWRRSLHDIRVERGADTALDHHLVVAVLRTKLKAYNNRAGRPSHRYNVCSRKEKEIAKRFKVELRNKFSALSQLAEETIE